MTFMENHLYKDIETGNIMIYVTHSPLGMWFFIGVEDNSNYIYFEEELDKVVKY